MFGAVANGILQSSGLLMVTMIGLINANLMMSDLSFKTCMYSLIGTRITQIYRTAGEAMGFEQF